MSGAPTRSAGTRTGTPGCVATAAFVFGVQFGVCVLLMGAAIASRAIEPRWVRVVPIAGAAVACWILQSRWALPRCERWAAVEPPTWGGLLSRRIARRRVWAIQTAAVAAFLAWAAWRPEG